VTKKLGMGGDSITRGMAPLIEARITAYDHWEPSGSLGTSADLKNTVVPEIKGLATQLDYVYLAYCIRTVKRTPTETDDQLESLATYQSNMSDAIDDLLANTAIECIMFGLGTWIDNPDYNNAWAPPYQLNDDVVEKNDALIAIIAAKNNSRLSVIDTRTLALGLEQSDYKHFTNASNMLLSNSVVDAILAITGDTKISENRIDLTGSDFGVAPYCAGQGNYNVSKNTGNMATLNGLYQNCEFVNCAVGKGYIYAENGSHISLEAAAPVDKLQSNHQLFFTSTNDFTIEIQSQFTSSGSTQTFCGAADGANDYWLFERLSGGRLRLLLNKGEVYNTVITVSTFLDRSFRTIHLVKTGSDLSFFVDGIPPDVYGTKNDYSQGTWSIINKTIIGNYGIGPAVWLGDLYWFMTYNRALSQDECLYNHELGLGMNGLIGTVNGDNMQLAYPSTARNNSSKINLGINTGI